MLCRMRQCLCDQRHSTNRTSGSRTEIWLRSERGVADIVAEGWSRKRCTRKCDILNSSKLYIRRFDMSISTEQR